MESEGIINEKIAFRKKMRDAILKKRDSWEELSKKAAFNFLSSPLYTEANCIACFLSLPQEIDTSRIVARSLIDKKTLLAPRIVSGTNEMEFYELEGLPLAHQTEINFYGIREPLPSLKLFRAKDFPAKTTVLVPGLAFSKDGMRLGRGKGYYDRFLKSLKDCNKKFLASGSVAAYCWDFQILESVPFSQGDQGVQFIVSDSGIEKVF